ncbi:hypothetical protein ACHAP8_009520 [Fusarium lateritium]
MANTSSDRPNVIQDNKVTFDIGNRRVDGNFVEYPSSNKWVYDIYFQFWIADEAHIAKKYRGSLRYAA